VTSALATRATLRLTVCGPAGSGPTDASSLDGDNYRPHGAMHKQGQRGALWLAGLEVNWPARSGRSTGRSVS
jgi:hypothetical protein